MLLLPLVCCVPPMHQITVPGRLLAIVRATRSSCATRHASDALGLFWIPLGDFVSDLVHAPNAGADELLVLPAVLEDVPEDAPDQRHVRTRAEPHVFVGMGCGARETWVANDQWRVVLLFRAQEVQQRNRVRFGRVAADHEDRPTVVDIVVAVGHGAVAPCVCHTRNRGRVADTRLMIDVVRAPVGRELAIQIGLLVRILG